MKLLKLLIFLLLGSCSSIFYQGNSYFYYNPEKFKVAYKDVDFKSTDGTNLHGWYLPSKVKAKGLVLYFHGNAQNITSHYLNLAWMLDEGYDIFIFDYRGFGLSEGQPNQQGVHKDALAAMELSYKWVQEKKLDKFIVYGQSLGGHIAARALVDFDKQKEVDLFVQDSTFSSYQKIGFHKLYHAGILKFISPIAYILVSDEYASRFHLEKIKNPTLVVHAKLDKVVPFEMGEIIYQKLQTDKKWFWPLEKGSHIQTFHGVNSNNRGKFLKLIESL